MATNSVVARYMGGMDQARNRGHAVWFDQHRSATYRDPKGGTPFENGRPYYSIIENATKMPVGTVMPLEWEAPIYAPQQYIVKSIGTITNLPTVMSEGLEHLRKGTVTDRFRIDYDAMERDDSEASLAHWRLAVAEAASRDWDVPRYGQPMDRRLIAIVGPAPRSPKVAQAFKAGNPWALGMKPPVFNQITGRMEIEEDEQLARVLTMNRMDLVTPDQMEAEEQERRDRLEVHADTDLMKELREMRDEAMAKMRELKAMQAAQADAPKKNKGGRPKKLPDPLAQG